MHHTSKKESKKEKEKDRVTKNLLQGDQNPVPPNTLELKMDGSIHWTTSVNADKACLKEVYIPPLWWLTVFKDVFFFGFRVELNI